MKSIFDFRLVLFLGTAFCGFYFGDTQFSQASEISKTEILESNPPQEILDLAHVDSGCVQLAGTYTLDAPSNCTDESVMPDFLVLGCSSGAVLPGQKLVIEQNGCETAVFKTFSMADLKNENPLSVCQIQASQGSANKKTLEEMFHMGQANLEVFKSSQIFSMKKKSLRSKIFFKASVNQSPVKVQLKGGVKVAQDRSLIFKTVKAKKSDQLEKIESACTFRRI